MKTNQVLTRQMGHFSVLQRTSDGMFNATALLKQWNNISGQKKVLAHYFENSSTIEFIEAIEKEENFKHRNSVYLKSRGRYSEGTWMHPLLFIDFAMWLNPAFKVKVLKFVYDELIKIRHEAGDTYRIMSSAVAKLVPASELKIRIPEIARGINYIVYNQHLPEIRNKQADEVKTRKLNEVQKEIARLIDLGFITTYPQLRTHLRKLYNENQAV